MSNGIANLVDWLNQTYIRVFTKRNGVVVGTDRYGNTYYRMKTTAPGQRERRWVMYVGEPEATKVPPEWHGWLHHEPAGQAVGEAAPGERDRHAPGLPAAGPHAGGRASGARHRRLSGLDAGLTARHDPRQPDADR
jgi:NADH:ubiquinone oxidoreductase subunit